MSERSYNLRLRAKARSRSETRPLSGVQPSTPTRWAAYPTIPTGEKGPAPGQHPVPEVAGSGMGPLPGSEMGSRSVLSLDPGDTNFNPARKWVLSQVIMYWLFNETAHVKPSSVQRRSIQHHNVCWSSTYILPLMNCAVLLHGRS